MRRRAAPLMLLAVLAACEDRRDVFLGALQSSGKGGAQGAGGGGVSDGTCASKPGAKVLRDLVGVPENACDLFARATPHSAGTDPKQEPAIVYPNDETKFPSNMPRVNCAWTGKAEHTLFELELRGPRGVLVVYTKAQSWQVADDVWQLLAQANQGEAVSYTVRALTAKGDVFEAAPRTLYFAGPLVDVPIYYWSTVARGLMRTDLSSSRPERLGFPNAGPEAGSCSGCHALSRDGSRLVADGDDGRAHVAMLAELAPVLVASGTGGAVGPGVGKMADKVAPDAPAAWSSFSPDATRLVQSFNGALTLLDGKGATLPGAMPLALPAKSVATHPDWSPLGDRIVFTLAEKGNGRAVEHGQIASVSVEADHFGPIEMLVTGQPADENDLFPSFSPDGKLVAYVSTHGKSDNSAAAALRLLRLEDSQVFELARLNQEMGFGNSMPTWAPASDPNQFWLAFSSTRAYPPLRDANPKFDQLWLAAVDMAQPDPSFAAFWAPFQQLEHGNHRAVWGTTAPVSSCGCTELCGDGVDNDCDGAIDEADCTSSSSCAASETCGDGIDNDCDCVIDDCPLVEICNDGLDNDFDGFIDGADAACGK